MMMKREIVLALLLIFHFSDFSLSSSLDVRIRQVLCNSGTYSGGNPFGFSRDYVLEELVEATPEQESNDFHNISPYPNAFAYGHARCDQNLTRLDCSACLRDARVAMLSTCQSRIGARAVLADCLMRYEQYPFAD